MKGIKKKINPPFFVSMATAAKFVQPILIFFLAYLVPQLYRAQFCDQFGRDGA
jgi:hypothetical protein